MKTNKLKFVRLSFAAVVACLTLAGLASFGAEAQGNRGQLSAHDYKFVTDAATGGMEEVALGKLATQKADNPQVKEFGQRMVTDHSKANDELKQLITQKGATIPATPTRSEERTMDKLQGLSGPDFDKTYMKNMVSDHKKDVKEFQRASTSVEDPDLKAWVNKTLPVLQNHLQMAESIETTITPTKSQARPQ